MRLARRAGAIAAAVSATAITVAALGPADHLAGSASASRPGPPVLP